MHERVKRLLEREGTGISWADLTMNFWIGCQEVSPACDHCYAREFTNARLNASRAKAGLPAVEWGPGGARQLTGETNRRKPLRWQRIAAEAGVRLTVFCSSLSDWADNAVPESWRAQMALTITDTPDLLWMLLTKRIGNARAMLEVMFPEGVPANVALGLTVANQEEADRDLPKALSVKAGLGIRRLFVSAEPLLGPLALARYLPGIDLVIVGGESGRGARIMNPAWVRQIRDDCAAAGTAFHFKQWGEFRPYADDRADGVWHDPDGYCYGGPTSWPPEPGEPRTFMIRVGTARAGYLLDNRQHREHFA